MGRKPTKLDILEKYKDEIIELTDSVFSFWAGASLPLALKIAQEEQLSLLEAKMLLDVLLVETIRDMADRHRVAEKIADKEVWGSEE